MSDLVELVAWLREQIDEDERAAQAAYDEASDYRVLGSRLAEEHFVLWKPDRVLAEVAAKRAILELHDGEHDCPELKTGVYPHDWPSAAPWGSAGEAWCHASSEYFEGPCPTVRLLAEPYAGRPGWREEWAT